MNNKGATLGGLYVATLTIIIVGLVLGIGLYAMFEVSEGVASESITVTNETPVVFANNTGTAVATASDCNARDFAIVSVWNESAGEIPSSNYTFSTAGTLIAIDGSPYEDVNANVSYTYTGTTRTATTDPCESLSTSITGLSGFSDWMTVIVVVLAASIVLVIVIGSFGKRSGV